MGKANDSLRKKKQYEKADLKIYTCNVCGETYNTNERKCWEDKEDGIICEECLIELEEDADNAWKLKERNHWPL
jgi:hypothetical protein